MLCHHRHNAITVTAGAGRVACLRQRSAQRGPASPAEGDAERAVSVKEQPWAPSGPVLGKGAATGELTAKVLRRKYSRGQWRRPKSYYGSMIVGRSLQQQLSRGRSTTACTLGALGEGGTLSRVAWSRGLHGEVGSGGGAASGKCLPIPRKVAWASPSHVRP